LWCVVSVDYSIFKSKNQYRMKKNNMYYDTQKAKIFKDEYRPSPNLLRFVKSLMTVVVSGRSTIGSSAAEKRKFH